jgi:hypothetical protein
MEVQSNENAALLKLLKSKSRTKTELLKVSSARRRARQAALDALLAEGKVIRIDKEYFANDPWHTGRNVEIIGAQLLCRFSNVSAKGGALHCCARPSSFQTLDKMINTPKRERLRSTARKHPVWTTLMRIFIVFSSGRLGVKRRMTRH